MLESGLQVDNGRPVAEEGDLQADSQLNVCVAGLEVYMNSQRTNLVDLMTPGSDQRATILYPTEIVVESQFFENRSLRINDMQVSMVELETSFR